MKNTLSICFLIFIIYLAPAQNSAWDLQKCVDYAQKNNIALKQSEISTRINYNNATQSKASILPTVNAGAQHTYNFGRTIDRYTNTFANSQVLSQNFYVSSNVVLWSGLAQYNNIKANQYLYLSSAENYQQQRNDLALNVATAYINVIFSDEILQIAKAQYKITEEQLERTQKLADAGTLAKSAVFDLKAQLANEDVNVISSDNNYQIALLSLKQLLNLDTLQDFKISRPEVDILNNELATLSVQGIYEMALKNQHSVKGAEYNVMASERSLAVAKGRISPTLSATGSLGTGTSELDRNIDAVNIVDIEQSPYFIPNPIDPTAAPYPVYQPKTEVITSKKPFADQFKDNVNKSVGFTLSIPIFNGLQTITGVKNAKLNALNARYSQDLLEQNLYKTIAQSYANARAALNKYHASKLAVEASEQSFFYAEQKFNVGAISTFDYNNAKVRSQNALGNMVQAKYDYVFKLKVLDYYQGKELKF
ncbi:MAG: transporter [Bacteroidota bacterium]|jgi:outer membrane protein|nr:transporter [Bacteroidota bacterium]